MRVVRPGRPRGVFRFTLSLLIACGGSAGGGEDGAREAQPRVPGPRPPGPG